MGGNALCSRPSGSEGRWADFSLCFPEIANREILILWTVPSCFSLRFLDLGKIYLHLKGKEIPSLRAFMGKNHVLFCLNHVLFCFVCLFLIRLELLLGTLVGSVRASDAERDRGYQQTIQITGLHTHALTQV